MSEGKTTIKDILGPTDVERALEDVKEDMSKMGELSDIIILYGNKESGRWMINYSGDVGNILYMLYGAQAVLMQL